jgi:hypothetical protein
MTRIRALIFGPDWYFAKPLVRRVFVVMLAATLLFAAGHYGLISSAAPGLRAVGGPIWDRVSNLAAACGDFLYTRRRR